MSKPSHHTGRRFRNNYGSWNGQPPVAEVLRWLWQRRGLRIPTPEGELFRVRRPDVAFLQANRAQPTLTWIGHVTFLLQLGGLNILTDPHFGPRASPLPFAGPERRVPLPLTMDELPRIDVALLSHNHYDHLDRGSVRALARQAGGPPLFLLPLGLARWFRRQGIASVVELDWWQRHRVGGVEFHFLPCQHWSKRTPWDTNRSLWGGWLVDAGFRFYFAGDTGYSRDFIDIYTRFGSVDLAALPIGAYAPRWFMAPQHVDPEESVQIFQDLRPRRAVAMHWGTFVLTDEPLDEPPRRLAAALARAGVEPSRFGVMGFGETQYLSHSSVAASA